MTPNVSWQKSSDRGITGKVPYGHCIYDLQSSRNYIKYSLGSKNCIAWYQKNHIQALVICNWVIWRRPTNRAQGRRRPSRNYLSVFCTSAGPRSSHIFWSLAPCVESTYAWQWNTFVSLDDVQSPLSTRRRSPILVQMQGVVLSRMTASIWTLEIRILIG